MLRRTSEDDATWERAADRLILYPLSKLIFVSQQEYLLALQYGPQEMIPVNNLRLAKDSASG